MLASIVSGEFLLNIPYWLHFHMGSFSYTSHADLIFMEGVSLTHSVLVYFGYWGVFLTHPVQVSFFSERFLLHITNWPHLCLGSISYTSRAGFNMISGLALAHPILVSFLSG